jgi:Undecaprenyl-phosphate galactose phosphotransferase WbaP
MATASRAYHKRIEPLRSRVTHPQPQKSLTSRFVCVAILLASDVVAIALSLELAILERDHAIPNSFDHISSRALPFQHYLTFGWFWILQVAFLAIEGLYTQRRSLWNEVGQLVKATSLSLIAILGAATLAEESTRISRATILLMGLNLLFLLPIARFWTKKILGWTGLWRKRLLILGATDTARLALRGLSSDPILGYEVAGILDNDEKKRGEFIGSYLGNPVFVIGTLAETQHTLAALDAEDVLVAMPDLPESELLSLVHDLHTFCGNIYLVPQLWGLPMMNLQVDGFLSERVMMLKLSNNLAKPWNQWIKRGFDLIVGSIIMLIALPVFAILAALIKMDSEGPTLFIQERLGHLDRNFKCLKFRTMYTDGERRLQAYLENNPAAAEEWYRYAKLRAYDPRLTRAGRFLRRWSLDELPQLINVLKGEMSLVGPRPYLPRERSRIGSELHEILSARPGMTGLWQVSGRNDLTFDERVHLEAWYVRNWTLWLDCIILAKTVRVVASPSNFIGSDVPSSTKAFPLVFEDNTHTARSVRAAGQLNQGD